MKSDIESLVEKYAEQVGVVTPRVVYTVEEILAMPRRVTETRTVSALKYLGVYYKRAHTIFINVGLHDDLDDLEETIIHEMVHARFRSLKHGEEFERYMLRIDFGERFPPGRV